MLWAIPSAPRRAGVDGKSYLTATDSDRHAWWKERRGVLTATCSVFPMELVGLIGEYDSPPVELRFTWMEAILNQRVTYNCRSRYLFSRTWKDGDRNCSWDFNDSDEGLSDYEHEFGGVGECDVKFERAINLIRRWFRRHQSNFVLCHRGQRKRELRRLATQIMALEREHGCQFNIENHSEGQYIEFYNHGRRFNIEHQNEEGQYIKLSDCPPARYFCFFER